jgi:hypothetical protein
MRSRTIHSRVCLSKKEKKRKVCNCNNLIDCEVAKEVIFRYLKLVEEIERAQLKRS